MSDLEKIYENQINQGHNFYASSGHEKAELINVKRVQEHAKRLEHHIHTIPDRQIKNNLLHELRFIKEYIDEMINLHQ